MKETDKAYIAGFIDADGCITLNKAHTKNYGITRNVYKPYLAIANTDKETLLWIQRKLGGNLYKKNKVFGNRQVSYDLKFTKQDELIRVLNLLRPYLRMKGYLADLVLEFVGLRKKAKIVTGRGSKGKSSYTERELEIYKTIRDRFKDIVRPNANT